MIMVMAIAATILASTTTESRAVSEGGDRLQAHYVAEAGFNATLHWIKNTVSLTSINAAASAAARTWTFGRGTVTTTAVIRGDLLVITAVGAYGRATQMVTACVDVGFDVPISFRYAASAGGTLDLRDGAVLESFHSSDGAVPVDLLANPPTAYGGRRGDAYGALSISAPSGSIHEGYSYLPEGVDASAAQSSLGVVRLERPIAHRAIRRPPSVASPVTSLTVSVATLILSGGAADMTRKITPGTVRTYNNLTVNSGCTLVINGPGTVVVNGDFTLQSNATVTINNASGPVALYIGDDLAMASGSKFTTTTTISANFNIWMYGEDGEVIDIRGPGFYGTFYHGGVMNPEAPVRLRQGAAIFGACVVRNEVLELRGESRIIYDQDLSGIAFPASTRPTFEVSGWRSGL